MATLRMVSTSNDQPMQLPRSNWLAAVRHGISKLRSDARCAQRRRHPVRLDLRDDRPSAPISLGEVRAIFAALRQPRWLIAYPSVHEGFLGARRFPVYRAHGSMMVSA